jgi:hypothetical protein
MDKVWRKSFCASFLIFKPRLLYTNFPVTMRFFYNFYASILLFQTDCFHLILSQLDIVSMVRVIIIRLFYVLSIFTIYPAAIWVSALFTRLWHCVLTIWGPASHHDSNFPSFNELLCIALWNNQYVHIHVLIYSDVHSYFTLFTFSLTCSLFRKAGY